jgi:hypothetical protein
MDLQKINVKFFVEDPGAVSPEAFVLLFNAWIQASDGEYYDIADYAHVEAGPGILLIAHEANVAMDNTENRWGLLYNRKQPLPGSNGEKLCRVLKAALENCRRIEEASSLEGKVKFHADEALFLINDRLSAPNSEATFNALKADLETAAHALYGNADFVLERESEDPRKRFGARITAAGRFNVAALLANLDKGSGNGNRRPVS